MLTDLGSDGLRNKVTLVHLDITSKDSIANAIAILHDWYGRVDAVYIGDVDLKRYEAFKFGYLTTTASEFRSTQDIFWEELCRAGEGKLT